LRIDRYSVNPKMSTITGGRLTTGSAPGSAPWTTTEASELYDVPRWGQGYFSITDQGHLQVHPNKDASRGVDLKRLIDRLQLRGLAVPILLRFTDILKHRLGEIHGAFQTAITQHQYQGKYRCVFPIKVNQQRQVVEEVLNFGAEYGFGLEAGSKPELLAVAALARWRCWPRRWAARSSRWSRNTPNSN
jgi:arginine decarboxylase